MDYGIYFVYHIYRTLFKFMEKPMEEWKTIASNPLGYDRKLVQLKISKQIKMKKDREGSLR